MTGMVFGVMVFGVLLLAGLVYWAKKD